MGGEEIAQLQHPHKFMEEVDTANMRETLMIAGYSYISVRIAHFRNSSPSVRNS
jgi:hypothetical protein